MYSTQRDGSYVYAGGHRSESRLRRHVQLRDERRVVVRRYEDRPQRGPVSHRTRSLPGRHRLRHDAPPHSLLHAQHNSANYLLDL